MNLKQRVAVIGMTLAVIGGVTDAGAAANSANADSHGSCKRQFDTTVQTYLRTTDRRDARGFNALLHRDVIGVLPGGAVFDGRAEFAAFIDTFFARTDWTQTFELKHQVADCSTGFVLFDSVYAEPAAGYEQKLVIGLTFTREHGRWQLLGDQNTEVA
jgi:hypothetical protein